MSGSFDPVSGRPTGSAPTERSARRASLPSGTTPGKKKRRPTKATKRDQRNSKGGRGTGIVVVGLVVGIGLIVVALIPHGTGGSGAEATAEPEPTTTTTTTTTTAPSSTTTTTTTSANTWQPITVDDHVQYQVPPDWTPVNQFSLTYGEAEYEDYALIRDGASYLNTQCTTWPVAAGVYLDDSTGPTEAQATKYAKGLAAVAFGEPYGDVPTMDVKQSRHLDGDGWMGREIVVHASATTPDCDLSEGVVALLALSTDDEPDRTIMVVAYSGTAAPDGPQGVTEPTLRKIVESVTVS